MDNKKFLEELSNRLDLSLTTINQMVEGLGREFCKAAGDLDAIVVPGFGIFETKLREERISVSPASGKRMLVPPKIYLTFKQSPILKQKLNNG